jgi:hypothetical protein
VPHLCTAHSIGIHELNCLEIMGVAWLLVGISCLGKARLQIFETACFNRSHIPPREQTRSVSLLYDGDLFPPMPIECLLRRCQAEGEPNAAVRFAGNVHRWVLEGV